MPCFLHYITVLIENSMLLSEYGRFLTAIFYSAGQLDVPQRLIPS